MSQIRLLTSELYALEICHLVVRVSIFSWPLSICSSSYFQERGTAKYQLSLISFQIGPLTGKFHALEHGENNCFGTLYIEVESWNFICGIRMEKNMYTCIVLLSRIFSSKVMFLLWQTKWNIVSKIFRKDVWARTLKLGIMSRLPNLLLEIIIFSGVSPL